jgi:hypothetical protein
MSLLDDARLRDDPDDQCMDEWDSQKCKRHADRGECKTSPGSMIMDCAKTCDACKLQDPGERCKWDTMTSSMSAVQSHEAAYLEGGLDTMFQAIVADFPEYSPKVLHRDPWVVQLDNFTTPAEGKSLLKATGWPAAFERSGCVDCESASQERRTSTNAWCSDECQSLPDTQAVLQKIEKVTGAPQANYEPFQVLQYKEGEFYGEHHDCGFWGERYTAGPRILTFFMYLSDSTDGSGGTDFPSLGLTVVPKAGRAIMWPNVRNHNLLQWEPKTNHASLPTGHLKLAVNTWIHLYNYRVPELWNCERHGFMNMIKEEYVAGDIVEYHLHEKIVPGKRVTVKTSWSFATVLSGPSTVDDSSSFPSRARGREAYSIRFHKNRKNRMRQKNLVKRFVLPEDLRLVKRNAPKAPFHFVSPEDPKET